MLCSFQFYPNEPSHEIMVFFFCSKLILQTRMLSHLAGLDVWSLVSPFVYFHTSCVQTAKALARLHGCAGLPEPSLVAYMISTIMSWAGPNYDRHELVYAMEKLMISKGWQACAYVHYCLSIHCSHRIERRFRQNGASLTLLGGCALHEPCHEKTCFRGLRPVKSQTGLLSNWD